MMFIGIVKPHLPIMFDAPTIAIERGLNSLSKSRENSPISITVPAFPSYPAPRLNYKSFPGLKSRALPWKRRTFHLSAGAILVRISNWKTSHRTCVHGGVQKEESWQDQRARTVEGLSLIHISE